MNLKITIKVHAEIRPSERFAPVERAIEALKKIEKELHPIGEALIEVTGG